MTWEEIWNNIKAWLTSETLWGTIFKIALAIVIWIVSFKIINAIGRKIEKSGEKKNADKTIMKTLAYLFKLGMKIIVVITLIGFLGIDTSGLTALVASLGVCIGLAVNGAVANLAGGVLILLTRPFRVDDFIEAQGYSGTVSEIHITNTKLITPDNKVIRIPNGALSNGNIVNYSEMDVRRVDLQFSIAYSADYDKAREILLKICTEHELVLQDPAPFVRMKEHAASSVNINTRVWTKSGDYWTVYFDITEAVKREFDLHGIEIPFNQLDVHVKTDR
ncbi:MAG: mechanosensitive ion channel [Clostridia bacterium]|nr:mechanosensitive ion channel [Clostridia bacterium]